MPEDKREQMAKSLIQDWFGVELVRNETGILWGVEIDTRRVAKRVCI